MLWQCDGCGQVVESDPLGHDDWGGEVEAIGPDCKECDQPMGCIPGRLVDGAVVEDICPDCWIMTGSANTLPDSFRCHWCGRTKADLLRA